MHSQKLALGNIIPEYAHVAAGIDLLNSEKCIVTTRLHKIDNFELIVPNKTKCAGDLYNL